MHVQDSKYGMRTFFHAARLREAESYLWADFASVALEVYR